LKKKFALLVLGILFIFPVSAHAQSQYVIPSGESCGIRLFTDGISVISVQEITDINGQVVSPGHSAGIKKGDVILSAADIPLRTIEDLSDALNKNPNSLSLNVKRNCETLTLTINPARVDENNVKIGLWVRDSAAGIGTITYYHPERKSFAALGHGICDTDTGDILSVNSGNIRRCTNIHATKSVKGVPGELKGSFNGASIGEIELNCSCGVYGILNDGFIPSGNCIRTALKSEVKEGAAYIMTDAVDGTVKCYNAQITKIKPQASDTKSLVIKITDERLLSSTGGIVRGMSGCPILQGNLLIGAITHVFVNDPSKGYGILVENMLEAAEKIK